MSSNDQLKKLKIKRMIEELESIRGRGTELVTYYIPAGYDLPKILDHLSYEYSTAQNIKDKTTRQNVMDALAKIINYLKGLRQLPKNGLVILCGNVSDQPGKSDIRLWAIEPPEKLSIRLYRCDSKFILDPLKDLLEEKDVYGLVVLDRGEATIGLLKGKNIIVLEYKESWVPGKHHKGGQSALRFQRIIEQESHNWLKYVGDKARNYFDRYKDNLKGIIVGGPGPFKHDFVEGEYLPYYLKDKVIAIVDTGYANESGLKELVYKAKDILEKESIIREKKLLERFFSALARTPDQVVYGKEDVIKALEYGAAEVVLVSEDIERELLDRIIEMAEETGASVEIVSKQTPEGEQFSSFKIAALLRYKIF